jgi:hypothetical protein
MAKRLFVIDDDIWLHRKLWNLLFKMKSSWAIGRVSMKLQSNISDRADRTSFNSVTVKGLLLFSISNLT